MGARAWKPAGAVGARPVASKPGAGSDAKRGERLPVRYRSIWSLMLEDSGLNGAGLRIGWWTPTGMRWLTGCGVLTGWLAGCGVLVEAGGVTGFRGLITFREMLPSDTRSTTLSPLLTSCSWIPRANLRMTCRSTWWWMERAPKRRSQLLRSHPSTSEPHVKPILSDSLAECCVFSSACRRTCCCTSRVNGTKRTVASRCASTSSRLKTCCSICM
mmetsp:Transcript_7015/g.13342  ORF Transcript_7015/g.13342 Transcript_7015/m.13342 type:complete len:215 (-) Transcript_7015:1794-2438(-)